MDFAKLMSAQIAKKQQQQSPSPGPISGLDSDSTRYLKRRDIEAAREEAYLAKQAEKEHERVRKADKKRQLEDEESEQARERELKRQKLAEQSKKQRIEAEQKEERERRKRIGLPELPPEEEAKDGGVETPLPDGEMDLDEEELVKRLRKLSEPVRLFGETHKQRLRRYLRLEERQSQTTTSDGTLNVPRPKAAIPTTLEPVAEADMKVPAKAPPVSDAIGRMLLSRQLTSWFNLVLKEWARALAGRDEATKATFTGKAASNSMAQALGDLKPLFRRLERINSRPGDLPDDLLSPIAEIVQKAQERRYVEANDGYLRLSIGKAAWPIGVTMVGIHERSAREKLHESDKGKAHIMADEATRKILQSIKRTLTFAQTRWPPEDIGQMMG